MDVFKLEAFKLALFIVPGIITLRIKAALSISSPSKPLNTVIDGLVLTLIDHATFGLLKSVMDVFAHHRAVGAIKTFGAAIAGSPSVPGELGQAFRDAGGFPILIIAVVVGFVSAPYGTTDGISVYSEGSVSLTERARISFGPRPSPKHPMTLTLSLPAKTARALSARSIPFRKRQETTRSF